MGALNRHSNYESSLKTFLRRVHHETRHAQPLAVHYD